MGFFEIFTLLTGILYIVLEIRQHSFMWIVGVLTAVAAMIVFFRQGLYASFALNCYYFVISFWGLWQWMRLSGIKSQSETPSDSVIVRPLGRYIIIYSAVIFVAGTVGLGFVARWLGDPMGWLDVSVAVLSAIATWWLGRCHNEQWILWIFADGLSTVLCARLALSGNPSMWWMAILYIAYTLSAFYGLYYWKIHAQEVL